ncbi:NfeD family protein [Thermospira aquatica]|uniref:NfeD family protein n=1 Tax=Thermospira aquatica TaxID=2828656 RepID=A0AAX3BCE0_9SPIR|nr:NfeD family protein [Thermospira aquatica]URA09810.1 NfeD family protein [Thermospira aquatica]
MSWYAWVIVGVILLILEIFTAGFFIALIGIAALLVAVVSLFIHSLWLQLLIFTIFSVAIVWLFLPRIRRSLESHSVPTNQDAMINKVVRVTEEINNTTGKGYVKYYGDYFPATSLHGTIIPAGKEVIIRKIEGIRVFVEEVEKQ